MTRTIGIVITETLQPAAAARATVGDVLPLLQWLDRILADAVERAREMFSREGSAERFRGLYISDRDVDDLLARAPVATPPWGGKGGETEAGSSSRLDWLVDAFGLCELNRATLILALAPEVDLRYERIYAWLQDDVTRKRPSVDLVLNLFCRSPEERFAGIQHFQSDGDLLQHRLIELLPDSGAPHAALLARGIQIDERIVGFLLGYDSIDRRLAQHVTLWEEDDVVGAEPEWSRLGLRMRQAQARGQPLRAYFQGTPGSGRRRAARAAARAAGRPLLELALATLPADDEPACRVVDMAVREAWLQDAVLYLSDVDELSGPTRSMWQARLRASLERFAGAAILSGQTPWVPGSMGLPGVVPFRCGIPGPDARRRQWIEAMAGVARPARAAIVNDLAARFRFTRQQVGDAVAAAVAHASEGSSGPVTLSREDLFSAARKQSGHSLASLATRIEPVHRWDDLVVPEVTRQQLRELCQRVIHRERVMGSWGFGESLSRGKGINALFSGGSGTGKTMAAEIVAGELGLDLFRTELAGLVSKYIGETEKNLDRVFEAAERTDGILLFDEADALFGKRSEVNDSHDRYANLEISYLLQRMEQYDGVAILATNLRSNLDQAFVRRLAFSIHFPLPDERSRREIWNRVWPKKVPLAPDLDLDALADRFTLTGGSIRNIALASAFLAATADTAVTMAHVLLAVRREYEKVGKTLTDDELALSPR
jgi:AAA+ superfamily predicted ATPase